MNAGTLLIVVKELIALLLNRGILLPDGSFDQTKLDTIEEDLAFASAVEAILKAHGLNVPAKVEQIIQILPLLAGLLT